MPTIQRPTPCRRRRAPLAAVAVALVTSACGGGPEETATDDGAATPVTPTTETAPATEEMTSASATEDAADAADGTDVSGELLVSAATSLTDAFAAVDEAFEEAHPDVDVILNLAGSSSLREQILEGAPVDVFASANTSNMDQVADAGDAVDPQAFTTNRLQIAVPPGNPGDVTSLADFANEGLALGLCAEEVPCGDFAREALSALGITPAIDTNEPDVRALLTKVEVDELDAGITYVTDVTSTDGGVEGIDIPDKDNVVATYPIAVLAEAPNPTAATAFVDFVLDDAGQDILATYGFVSP